MKLKIKFYKKLRWDLKLDFILSWGPLFNLNLSPLGPLFRNFEGICLPNDWKMEKKGTNNTDWGTNMRSWGTKDRILGPKMCCEDLIPLIIPCRTSEERGCEAGDYKGNEQETVVEWGEERTPWNESPVRYHRDDHISTGRTTRLLVARCKSWDIMARNEPLWTIELVARHKKRNISSKIL